MENAKLLKIPGSVSYDTYQEALDKIDWLSRFVNNASIDRLVDLENKETKLASAEAKLQENELRLQDIEKAHQAELVRLKAAYELRLESAIKQYQADNRKNVNSKIKKPLESKINEAKKESLKWQDAYKNILNKLDDMTSLLYKIIEMLDSGKDKQEIKKVISQVMTPDQDIKIIKQLLDKGYNNKQIAEHMTKNMIWSCGQRTAENKVKQRRDSYGI